MFSYFSKIKTFQESGFTFVEARPFSRAAFLLIAGAFQSCPAPLFASKSLLKIS